MKGSRGNLSQSIEDYLKAIHEIALADGRASTQRIAAHLRVSPASVTGMIKKLAVTNPPLLDYRKHRGVVLTQAGERVALEILRHHELIELFLHQILGYDLADVHAEADRLEHVISEEFEERISKALGDPGRGPVGDPIPPRDLRADEVVLSALADTLSGQAVIFRGVLGSDPEVLRQVRTSGLTPDARIAVLDNAAADGTLTVRLEGLEAPVQFALPTAQAIVVRLLPPTRPTKRLDGEAAHESGESVDAHT